MLNLRTPLVWLTTILMDTRK